MSENDHNSSVLRIAVEITFAEGDDK
jgi:hypothetical protein